MPFDKMHKDAEAADDEVAGFTELGEELDENLEKDLEDSDPLA